MNVSDKKLKAAQDAYGILLEAMKIRGWSFTEDKDQLSIAFTVVGEDIPMSFLVLIDVERQLVRLYSKLPFAFSEERRLDGAIAVSIANYDLADGSFDLKLDDGSVYYRMTSSFLSSILSPALFLYMVTFSTLVVDAFNDKLLLVSNGAMSIEAFRKSIGEDIE